MTTLRDIGLRFSPQELQEMYPTGTTFESVVTNVRAGKAISTQGYPYIGLFVDGVHQGKGFTHSYRSTHINELLAPAFEILKIDTEIPDEEDIEKALALIAAKVKTQLVGQDVVWTLKYTKFDRSNPRFVPVSINGKSTLKVKKGKSA